MTNFSQVFVALASGKTVRRKKWQRGTTLAIVDGEMMQSNPKWKAQNAIQLDWDDVSAADWIVL